jgi:hypothetical protein
MEWKEWKERIKIQYAIMLRITLNDKQSEKDDTEC